MTGISTYASHKILDFLLGRQSAVVPSFFNVALSSTPLGNDGIGITEPTDPSYRRVTIPNNKISFSVANNKIVTIIKEFVFATSSVNWSRITHFAIFDDANNIWLYGELQQNADGTQGINVEIETSPIMYANTNSFRFDICGGSTSDMTITTTAAVGILNHFFGSSPVLVVPPVFYIGVSSTPTSAEGLGFTEPTSPDYQRLAIPNDKNSFTNAANKTVTFAKEFRFNSANVAWGNMTHYFISETPTGENVWWSGILVHSRNVEISTTLTILPKGFKWTLDSCQIPTSVTTMQNLSKINTLFWG